MKKALIATVSVLALMSIILFLPPSFATGGTIVQIKCFRNSSVSNNQNISLTLTSPATMGNVLAVVVDVQGATTQVMNYVNVSDGFQFYPLRVRTTDFANSLIVAIFTGTLNHSGVSTIYTQYHAATNVNNQVDFCAYEISGLSNSTPLHTFHQEGGNAVLPTNSTGLVLSGAVYNGGGGQIVFTGTLDDGSGGFIGIGHGSGSYSGVTGVTFSEEADISFSLDVTVTSTITGFLVPNFVNGVNSFSWLYFLIVVMVPMAEIIGVITMERNSVLDRHAIIFIFLSLLLLDSIFGVMLNVVTVAMPFIFGILFGVYLWRGRG